MKTAAVKTGEAQICQTSSLKSTENIISEACTGHTCSECRISKELSGFSECRASKELRGSSGCRTSKELRGSSECRTSKELRGSSARILCCTAAAAYTLFMLYLLFVRNRGGVPADPEIWRRKNLNLIPFRSITEYVSFLLNETNPGKIRSSVINLMGNFVMFIPFGFMIPLLFRKFRSLFRTVLLMATAVTITEVMQLLTCRGSCDVDDLLLNLAGVVTGYFIFPAAVPKSFI